ncbi:AraC family transcriptional regulator [Xanthocytophaga flava]|nr:AraC family transcriptional regulator [Xanthocytophaga flavus]
MGVITYIAAIPGTSKGISGVYMLTTSKTVKMINHISIQPENIFLRKFVTEFVILETENGQTLHKEFVPKNGMVWALTNLPVTIHNSQFRNFLIGIQTEPLPMKWEKGKGVFVRFSPYGMSRFTTIQMDKFANTIIESDSVWGNKANELNHCLLSHTNLKENISLIEDFLIARVRKPSDIEQAIFDMVDAWDLNDDLSITELKQTIPLSNRQLERKFKQLIGVNIQSYRRISRFQKAFKQMQFEYNTLTDVGYNSGYFDQSHFSRDFKFFTNYRPNHFFEKADFYRQLNKLIRTSSAV